MVMKGLVMSAIMNCAIAWYQVIKWEGMHDELIRYQSHAACVLESV